MSTGALGLTHVEGCCAVLQTNDKALAKEVALIKDFYVEGEVNFKTRLGLL